jgi:hypothetical protein
LLTDIISTPFNLVTLLIDGKLTRSSFWVLSLKQSLFNLFCDLDGLTNILSED